ncbi:hypothetical protein ACP275_06G102500 [Erythranthe tilingii]
MSSSNDEKEIFSVSGPTFLTAVDWNNWHHRRSVVASLVKGVYTLERDRRYHRKGPHALAPPWWEFFNFKLLKLLVDNHDTSYFGAIYEYAPPYPHHPHINYFGQRPPQYVVAFRGTINMPGNRKQDFKLNLHVIINNLKRSTRFQIGLESVCDIIKHVGPSSGSVWLAGHSLGSSIALVLGREMVKQTGARLETYLFNPPFISPPVGRITNETLKIGLRLVNSVITAGLALAFRVAGRRRSSRNADDQEPDQFTVLSSWVPYLFVNPLDPICSEYAGYFKHREDMESIGAGRIAKIATKHSIGSILTSVTGKKDSSEALHLIPSAHLTINSSRLQSFKEAHGIQQWWRRDLQFEYKSYKYN